MSFWLRGLYKMKPLPLVLILTLLLLTSCGSGASKKHGEIAPISNSDFSDTFVYDSSSPYSDLLIKCIAITEEKNSCSLQQLPFLAQIDKTPTKEMIMKRVVVSHQWMGDRFSEMLDLLEDDIKILLGAVTAIVIDDDIIPSYYWGATGAIYIDPRYLWLTPQEASTISDKEDYRAQFSNELQFLIYIENKIDGKLINPYSLDQNSTRTKEDIKLNLARLLYHELAHANDFFPYHLRTEIQTDNTVLEFLESIYTQSITSKLYNTYPLTNDTLLNIGKVIYHGERATAEQKSLTASEIGQLFNSDFAVHMYGYSSPFEDTATLFETSMMKLHYNIEQDFAFLEKPIKENDLKCSDYIIGWGVRNRIAHEQIKPRALLVTKSILPNMNSLDRLFEEKLGNSQLLETQIDWCSATYLNKNGQKTVPNRSKINHIVTDISRFKQAK